MLACNTYNHILVNPLKPRGKINRKLSQNSHDFTPNTLDLKHFQESETGSLTLL